MHEIIPLLKKRINGKPNAYGREIGIPASTLFSYLNGNRGIGITGAQKMIKYYKSVNDTEMVNVLKSYILGE